MTGTWWEDLDEADKEILKIWYKQSKYALAYGASPKTIGLTDEQAKVFNADKPIEVSGKLNEKLYGRTNVIAQSEVSQAMAISEMLKISDDKKEKLRTMNREIKYRAWHREHRKMYWFDLM